MVAPLDPGDDIDAAYEAAAWGWEEEEDGRELHADREDREDGEAAGRAKRRRLAEQGEGRALRRQGGSGGAKEAGGAGMEQPQQEEGQQLEEEEEEQEEDGDDAPPSSSSKKTRRPPAPAVQYDGLRGGLKGFNAGRRRLARAVQAALDGGGDSSGEEGEDNDGEGDGGAGRMERAALEAEASRIAAGMAAWGRGRGRGRGRGGRAAGGRGGAAGAEPGVKRKRQGLPDERVPEGSVEAAAMQELLLEVRGARWGLWVWFLAPGGLAVISITVLNAFALTPNHANPTQ